MKKVLQITEKRKVKKAKAAQIQTLQEYGAWDVDSKVALIQQLIPLGLMHIQDLLRQEVLELAGEKYQRNGKAGYDHWGGQRGSVYVKDQKIPIRVPRVRDVRNNQEVSLSSYERFQEPREVEEMALKRLLHGLSCRTYGECAEAIPEAFSLSPSSVSRKYIRASSRQLKELMERTLDQYDFISFIMDGKSFGEDGMIVAIGVTMEGQKVILGLIESSTENHKVTKEFLLNLIERGLRYDQGLLVVLDGAKGFRKAIQEVFGIYGIVQRCQWHKQENVVSYLPKGRQAEFRQKLQAAYGKSSYEQAKAAFQAIKTELKLLNQSALGSLEEGFEETLTILRLGMPGPMKRSFRTTNMIESIHALVGQKTDKVDCWKNSNQKQRWVATSLLYIERRLNKVNGYKSLPFLRDALQSEIERLVGKDKREVAAA